MATQTNEALTTALPVRSAFETRDFDPTDTPNYQFPDPPHRLDMQNAIHLNKPAYFAALSWHFGAPETTVVASEAYLGWSTYQRGGWFVPDLLIAFNADMAGAVERNGYAIDEQGKPPNFVLEIASKSTGRRDDTVKRVGYANYGVQEYWRFDPSGGERHQTHLAGDRLVNGEYQPIEITKVDDENYRGHSEVLGLELRWEQGKLRWYDPAQQRYLQTYNEEAEAHVAAEARAQDAEARMQAAKDRAQAAETRNRELQAELERLRRQS